jgi:hypothetical protein
MNLQKLFRLLVVGGAVMAGAPACGPEDMPAPKDPGTGTGGGVQSSTDPQTASDGGVTTDPGTGGGVNFW